MLKCLPPAFTAAKIRSPVVWRSSDAVHWNHTSADSMYTRCPTRCPNDVSAVAMPGCQMYQSRLEFVLFALDSMNHLDLDHLDCYRCPRSDISLGLHIRHVKIYTVIYDIMYIYIYLFIYSYICQYISMFNRCHDPSVIFQSEVSTHWSCGWGQNPHRDRAADRAVLFTKFRSYQKYKFRSTSRHAEMFGFRMESSKGKVQHQAPCSSLVQSIWLSQCILISISSKSPANGIVFDLLIQT